MERVPGLRTSHGDTGRCAGFDLAPSPLSVERDEIVAYMRYIGERRTGGRD